MTENRGRLPKEYDIIKRSKVLFEKEEKKENKEIYRCPNCKAKLNEYYCPSCDR